FVPRADINDPQMRPRTEAASTPGLSRFNAPFYLERLHTASAFVPVVVAGLVYRNSSAVREVMIRFCSPPVRFGYELPSMPIGVNRRKTSRGSATTLCSRACFGEITDCNERGYRCGLFHSLEHQFNYPATGPRRIAPLQFISGDRDRSWLRSTYPVRKRTVLDFQREVLVRY